MRRSRLSGMSLGGTIGAKKSMRQLKRVLPTIVLAAGVVAATAISAANPTNWLGYAGIVVLSLSVLVARALDRMWTRANKGCWRQALNLSGSILVVGAAIVYVNPALIGILIPMIGAGSFTVLSEPFSCFLRREVSERGPTPAR